MKGLEAWATAMSIVGATVNLELAIIPIKVIRQCL
jgi:hypothetical protein